MDTTFYVATGIWSIAMVAIFIMAIRLSYRIEARSPDLQSSTGVPQRAQMLHTVTNWKVARDPETQSLRQRMNVLLLVNLIGFVLLWVLIAAAGRAGG